MEIESLLTCIHSYTVSFFIDHVLVIFFVSLAALDDDIVRYDHVHKLKKKGKK